MIEYVYFILPYIKLFGGALLFLVLCAVGGYYFFIIRTRRKWYCNLYEIKSDGGLHWITKDVLIRKPFDGGRRCMYQFKKVKGVTFPPEYEGTERKGNKEYCDYIRLPNNEFIQLKKSFLSAEFKNIFKDKALLEKIGHKIGKWTQEAMSLDPKKINTDYIYVPTKRRYIGIKHSPVEYDVDVMINSELDVRSQFYKLKSDFWSKYGTYIMMGALVILMIVVVYLNIEFTKDVIDSALGAADRVAGPLDRIVDSLTGGADTPPA